MSAEGDALFDAGVDFAAERNEVADGAEVDVRGVVPAVGQLAVDRHPAGNPERGADAPIAEIRE